MDTRFDLYFIVHNSKDNSSFTNIINSIIHNDKLSNLDIFPKVFYIPNDNDPIRGCIPGDITLVGYFDDDKIKDIKYHTQFTRISEDKCVGVCLYHHNLLTLLEYSSIDSVVESVITSIVNCVNFFSSINTKLSTNK